MPDANLAAAIKDELGITNRELTEADLQTLTFLHAEDRGITNLEGLQYAAGLQFLSLDRNKIIALTPLKGRSS